MGENNSMVRQSNALTECRCDFDKIERRCFYLIIRSVRKNYVEGTNSFFNNQVVTIPQRDLDDATSDIANRNTVRNSLIKLRHKDIQLESTDGSWFNCGYINWSKYNAANKVYQVEVCGQILPYLVELASKYTEFSLNVAITLKSKWSQRFYELCCQYKSLGKFGKTITQLRQMFMLENKYPQLPLFKQKVIEVAQKELKTAYDENQCDVWFDYTQTGRGIDAHFEFYVHTKERDARQQEIWKDLDNEIKYIYAVLKESFKKDPKYVARVINALNLDTDKIRPIFNKITKTEKDFKGNDLSRLLRWLLREDFGIE